MSVRTVILLVASLLLCIGGFALYLATQEPGPLVIVHGPNAIGGQAFELDVSVDSHQTSLGSFDAVLVQGGQRHPLTTLGPATGARVTQETPERVRIRQTVAAGSLKGLKSGAAQFELEAARPVLFGLRQARTTMTVPVEVRLTPPTIQAVSTHHYINLGGAEAVVYRVTPPEAVSGVLVGDRFYRGYPASGVAGGRATDRTLHVAFFALAFDQDPGLPIRLTARDAVGNSALADFDHQSFAKSFTYSRIPIDDRFLTRVLPGIVAGTPGLSLPLTTPEERVESFLSINREVRAANASQIAALADQTSPEWLGTGSFKRMAGSKSEAPFAEHRTYMLGTQEIDQQVHLGFDLASTRGAAVTASNTGRVLFAGYLGIYGNCVVLDHGMGVQTLYGHLSSMDVEKGDRVEKGETIGRSGATGMAGGDHVHFTVLVGGTPVTPIEWWDSHWMRDRVDRKLADAGIR